MADDSIQPRSGFYSDLNATILNLNILVSRIDERVHALIFSQGKVETKLDEQADLIAGIIQRVGAGELIQAECRKTSEKVDRVCDRLAIIEDRVTAVEGDTGRSSDKWKKITDFGIKLLWTVVAAAILWKLKLSPPP